MAAGLRRPFVFRGGLRSSDGSGRATGGVEFAPGRVSVPRIDDWHAVDAVEIRDVAGGERQPRGAGDGGDLGVFHADWTPRAGTGRDDGRVFAGGEQVAGRPSGPGGALIEVELDRDDDGHVEECVKLVNGQIAGVGFSTAQDGIIDAWAYRDAEGQISRIEISTRRDHIVERWEHYTNGVLTRVQVDADGDGKPDPAR
jgi:hypothetical protein